MSNIPYTILWTINFNDWFEAISFNQQIKIKGRLDKIRIGHFGDYKRFEGLIELRWKNGLRIYAFVREQNVFVVLVGGNKNGQKKDIRKAKKIKENILSGVCVFQGSRS